MALQINLAKDVEEQLRIEAAAVGMDPGALAEQLVEEGLHSLARPQNGKEVVEYLRRIGFIGSRPDIKDSVAHARKIREQASRRER